LFLRPTLVYDTLRKTTSDGNMQDSLVLSKDMKPKVLTTLYPGYLTTGWQNRIPPPEKMLLKRRRLYRLTIDGRVNTGRQLEFWTKKRHPTYMVRKSG
jgi:hypothetical protein